jgi:hypothetical protein
MMAEHQKSTGDGEPLTQGVCLLVTDDGGPSKDFSLSMATAEYQQGCCLPLMRADRQKEFGVEADLLLLLLLLRSGGVNAIE